MAIGLVLLFIAYVKRSDAVDEVYQTEGRRFRAQLARLNAYEQHKFLINQYILYHPGATKYLQRDTSRDKRDIDIIQENHKFLWESGETPLTWGQQLAKRYYDKLYKEYCICDLSRYKENKVGMRWQTEKEVVEGKGQFICSEKRCPIKENLRTWETNFAYLEKSEKKNALVKLRLCHDCSYKLNYRTKKKEVTKKSKKKKMKYQKEKKEEEEEAGSRAKEEVSQGDDSIGTPPTEVPQADESIWAAPIDVPEEKSRDEEFEEYLEDLLL
ncbi:protein FRA10AC1 homolog isoform X2 [Oratosquilla oratoria]|uniref:protein FRA10AC1 homolog isoform X2 n=1 Tax=Oratosquilla oratoria TaxID=337810 RepID=UPI003F75A15E